MRALVNVTDYNRQIQYATVVLFHGEPTGIGQDLITTAAALNHIGCDPKDLGFAMIGKLNMEAKLIILSGHSLDHYESFIYTLFPTKSGLHLEFEAYGVVQYSGLLMGFRPLETEKRLIKVK